MRRTIWICLATALAGCGSIPTRTPPAEPAALPAATSGTLHSVAREVAAGLDDGESAFWLLDRADFSFEVRLALADQAADSLDIQYFIWEKDPTSRLFSHRVVQAADRGVRVRILLDDLTLNGQDGEFLALDSHPNISVRSFNPWRSRRNIGRVGEYLLNIDRLNHRMHNKTIIADRHFAILGGRNIGDRYFGVWDDFVQNDLDIMASGPAASEVADSFNLYWNSSLSYAIEDLAGRKAKRQALEPTTEMLRASYLSEEARLIEFPLQPVTWDELFERLVNTYTAGAGTLWQDLPEVELARPDQLYAPIYEMLEMAEHRVLLSTAYLVPDQAFVDLLAGITARGVEVTVLTNSLASNNHKVAHMAYKPWRRRLLGLGIELYEARDDSAFIGEYSAPPIEPEFLGLHSKAIVVDDRLSFVGSPNIDPRSLIINTELGFFIDSVELADRLTVLIERDISPDAAWRVYFDERGRIRWESSAGVIRNQPALGFLQRVAAFFINLLPLKSQA
ncbi:MAG TPA: phospholipase D family protein [Gammaproteobacteria bacterium]|nr:phospholipase D family protein [Gammaproteobacteria bacterium]